MWLLVLAAPAAVSAAAPVTTLARSGHTLWLGREGSVEHIVIDPEGDLHTAERLGVGAAARPVAVAIAPKSCFSYRFVLDAQSARILVFRRKHRDTPLRRLAVGAAPVSLAVGSGGTPRCYVAAANSGSDDLSAYAFGQRGFSAERRIPVGSRPSALAAFDYGLLVADEASGTVTVLDPFQRFKRLGTVPVGGSPSVLVAVNLGFPAFIVGDAASSRLRAWYSDDSSAGYDPGPALDLPSPMGRPTSLTVADVNDDKRADVLVGDAVDQSVVAFDSAGPKRALGPARTIMSGVAPVGIAAGLFAGDYHRDVAVADTISNGVRLRVTPGDRLIPAGGGIRDLTAGAGRLAWSRRAARHRYRLVLRADDLIADVPVAPSRRLLRPRLGRLAPGRPAVAHVICRRARCAPYAWDIAAHRERRLALPQHTGCQVREAAVWDRWTAEALQRAAHHPPCAGGVWLGRDGHFVRREPRLTWGTLGDLRQGRLLRSGYSSRQGTSYWKLLTSRVGRRDERALVTDPEEEGMSSSLLDGSRPVISGRYAYWEYSIFDPTFWDLVRTPLTPRGCGAQSWVTRGYGTDLPYDALGGNFAVNRGHVYYAVGSGVFEAAPSRVRWYHDRTWC